MMNWLTIQILTQRVTIQIKDVRAGVYMDINDKSLAPGDAVAAIILIGNQYLLQHRDNKPEIFFPDHWGCFGGNVEAGESQGEALARELSEELGFQVDVATCVPFTRFDFDFSFAECGNIYRLFYELRLPVGSQSTLHLGEGQAMGLFDPPELLDGSLRLTPYDSFALWMHISKGRFQPEMA
jgi:8-oxo-dGTP pyrophosphatase MutT (NUDIX family)